MNTYIEKAQEVYEKILNKDIDIYRFFMKTILTSFGIKNHSQLYILSNCLKVNDARYLRVNFHEEGACELTVGETVIHYDFSFKDNVEQETPEILPELTEYNIDLTKHKLYNSCCVDNIPDFKGIPGVPGVYSLLATLKLWEIILCKYEVDNLEQLSYSSEELQCVYKRSFGEYCVRLMWKNNKEQLQNYCDATTLLFFVFLWKSITIGEFYIVPDYEKKIYIIKEYSEKTEGRILPAFTSYYPEICSSFNTFINRIRPYDEKDDGIAYNLDTNPKTIANKVIDTYSNQFIKTKMLKPLIELTEQLFEITVIDLNYSTSEKNIAKLVDFISSLNIFKTQTFNLSKPSDTLSASILLGHIDSTALEIFENVIELLLYKTSILTNQIIKQTEDVILKPKTRVPVICNRYKLANDRINNIISGYSLGTYEEDPFYSLYCSHKNKDLNLSSIHTIQTSKIPSSDYWWVKYNTNIDNAIELRKTNSHLMYSIHYHQEHALAEIQQFIERQRDDKNKYEYKYTSPSTYVSAIVWLYDYIILKKNDENRSEIRLFGELLKCFRRYINLYKNINCVPQTFRSYFEYSFCTKQENTLKKVLIDTVAITGENTLAIKDYIFFASIGYQPFNVESLETCFYYYNLELKSLEREAIDASLTASKSATKKANDTTERIDKSVKEYREVKKQADELKTQIEDERGKTLQLVGLLGVFIAFVSSTVGTLTVASDIFKFILFATTFITGLLVFIFSISFITQKDFEWKKSHTANVILIVFLVIGIVVLSLIVMPSESESKSTNQTVVENAESPINEKPEPPTSDVKTNDMGCPQDSCNNVASNPVVVKKDTSANNNAKKQKGQSQLQ